VLSRSQLTSRTGARVLSRSQLTTRTDAGASPGVCHPAAAADSLAPPHARAQTLCVLLKQVTASEQRVTSGTPVQRTHSQLAWQLFVAARSLAHLFPPQSALCLGSSTRVFPPSTRLPLAKTIIVTAVLPDCDCLQNPQQLKRQKSLLSQGPFERCQARNVARH